MSEPLPPSTPPEPSPSASGARRWRWPLLIAGVALATVALLALLTNIFERQQEARTPFYRIAELTDTTTNPATWGQNFPLQYDSYLRTVDMERICLLGERMGLPGLDELPPRSEVERRRQRDGIRIDL